MSNERYLGIRSRNRVPRKCTTNILSSKMVMLAACVFISKTHSGKVTLAKLPSSSDGGNGFLKITAVENCLNYLSNSSFFLIFNRFNYTNPTLSFSLSIDSPFLLHFSLLSFTISDINFPVLRNELLEINANSVPPFISLAQIRCIDNLLLPRDNLHFDLARNVLRSGEGEKKLIARCLATKYALRYLCDG